MKIRTLLIVAAATGLAGLGLAGCVQDQYGYGAGYGYGYGSYYGRYDYGYPYSYSYGYPYAYGGIGYYGGPRHVYRSHTGAGHWRR